MMKQFCKVLLSVLPLAAVSIPAFATIHISGFSASLTSPQVIGTAITWTATATDTGAGPLTFQFNIQSPASTSYALARDYNAGTLNAGTWTSPAFTWVPTGVEGAYKVEVVAKDFGTGEMAATTATFTVNPLVTGSAPVVAPTSNPLVALFSAPSCAAGSSMRVSFQIPGKVTSAMTTNYVACHPPYTMTFEIAGMYPRATYSMFSQTKTGGTVSNGPPVSFTTGTLPSGIQFPPYTVLTKPGTHSDKAAPVLLNSLILNSVPYLSAATDLSGHIIWYYYQADNTTHFSLLTRPVSGGGFLMIQDGQAWSPLTTRQQMIRQIDLAGNIVRETNAGVLQQELLKLGAADAVPCESVPRPAPVGATCMGGFHHEAVQFANGNIGLIGDIEKIYPPGTQGDPSTLPVDVVGDIIIILNANWQATYYWDAFEHAGGGTQLDVNRGPLLGETCSAYEAGCPPILLLGSGIAPLSHDWLHANSLYLWSNDSYGGAGNDLLLSMRHQDWVIKIDYNNGAGSGNIIWRLGPCGDFSFNNVNNDPWPWFSHQHEVAIENNGAGPITIMDNGNTRVSPPSGFGSSSGCMPGVGSGNSRGMALTLDEATLSATPVLSQDLGYFSTAMGSAQLLSDQDYYFYLGVVFLNLTTLESFSQEIYPTAGTVDGSNVLNISTTDGYRGWQMPNLYSPPGS